LVTPGAPQLFSSGGLPLRVFPFGSVVGLPLCSAGRAELTPQLRRLCAWLSAHGAQHVAMEATGVFWIPVHDTLQHAGFLPTLFHGAHARNLPGKKSDFSDCQWHAVLHSHGLLRPCFIPGEAVRALRAYARLREDHLHQAAICVAHMQRALDCMNVRLRTVISQLHGVSGLLLARPTTYPKQCGWAIAGLREAAGCALRSGRWMAARGRRRSQVARRRRKWVGRGGSFPGQMASGSEGEGGGGGVVLGVAETDPDFADAEAGGGGGGGAGEDDVGFARLFAADADFAEGHLAAEAGAEGFGDGFLRGEAGGVIRVRVAHGGAVGDLFGGEDALEEGFAVAQDGGAEARGLHDVGAEAEEGHGELVTGDW
jgi:hypothetical protein